MSSLIKVKIGLLYDKVFYGSLLYCQLKSSKTHYKTVHYVYLKNNLKCDENIYLKKDTCSSQNVFVIYIQNNSLMNAFLNVIAITVYLYSILCMLWWRSNRYSKKIMVTVFHWLSNIKCKLELKNFKCTLFTWKVQYVICSGFLISMHIMFSAYANS